MKTEVRLVVGVLCVLACESSGGSVHEPSAEVPPTRQPVSEKASAVAPAAAFLARAKKGEDGPTRNLSAGANLHTGQVGSWTVDFRDGARAIVGPESRVVLGDETPAELYLAEGRLTAIAPPVGNTPRPALRVALPEVTAVLEQSGEMGVATARDGRALVLVLQGRAVVVTGATGDEGSGALASWEVQAGQMLRVTGKGPPARGSAPEEAEGRERLLSGLFSAARAGGPPEMEGPEAVLRAAVERLEAERARGEALVQRHREAVRTGGGGEKPLREALLSHSRARYRLAALTLTLWERVRALALLRGEVPSPALAARVKRARAP